MEGGWGRQCNMGWYRAAILLKQYQNSIAYLLPQLQQGGKNKTARRRHFSGVDFEKDAHRLRTRRSQGQLTCPKVTNQSDRSGAGLWGQEARPNPISSHLCLCCWSSVTKEPCMSQKAVTSPAPLTEQPARRAPSRVQAPRSLSSDICGVERA